MVDDDLAGVGAVLHWLSFVPRRYQLSRALDLWDDFLLQPPFAVGSSRSPTIIELQTRFTGFVFVTL